MPVPLTLTSPSFADGSPIPRAFTCQGSDVSPALAWDGVPAGTASLALIVEDPDAPGGTFVHWVAYDIAVAATGPAHLAEGASGSPSAGREGPNSFGRLGYSGPCPPPGTTHHYRFVLSALDRIVGRPGLTATQLRAEMKGHVLAETVLVGTFRR